MVNVISIGDFSIGSGPLAVIAGPCSLENLDISMEVAKSVKNICMKLGVGFIFKASFDKANRTSIDSYRGPGMDKGLEWLEEIRTNLSVPVLTDIHEPWQAAPVSEVVDVLQIPAFLCRQTDLLVAASVTGKPINVKKAQFLAPVDMASVVDKCRRSGNTKIMLCERGTTMGYNQLVVDMRSLPVMRELGCPVVFDATHSVQMPGSKGGSSGGDRRFALSLARAAVAVGIDAIFVETHPDPDVALSDGPNMIPLDKMEYFLGQVKKIDDLVKGNIGIGTLDWTGGGR